MIYKAKYVLPITAEPIRNGGVLVRGDLIEAVGADLDKAHPEEPLTDLGDAILLPGFVNAHSHLDYTILRGAIDDLLLFPWIHVVTEHARRMRPEDFFWSSFLGVAELIQAGVTTTADASFSGQSMEALLQSGLRGVVYQEVFGYRGGDYAPEIGLLQGQMDAMAERATERVRMGISPHSIYTVAPLLLQAVHALAHDEGFPMAIHVAESQAEYELCAAGTGEIARIYRDANVEWRAPGVSPVQYLYDLDILDENLLAAHCVYLDENDVRLLAVSRTGVAHCPRSNAKLGVGVAPVEALLNAGVRMGLGTDSAISNNTLDICGEIGCSILMRRVTGGKPAEGDARRMVEAATIGGARALSMENEIGSIEPGKKADLTAIDISTPRCFPDNNLYSLLAYCATGRDVVMTMVDGVVLYKHGNFVTVDPLEIRQNAKRSVNELLLGGQN